MQTALADFIRDTNEGRDADRILRTCVHCGFCNATCPTYQLLGDELDGPRGRIYLIKQMLEGEKAGPGTLTHLDRCLTCRNCETTCPSGVNYGQLLEIGRELAEQTIARPATQRLARWTLRHVIPYRNRFTPLLRLGQFVRPLFPAVLKSKIPPRQHPPAWPNAQHARRMLLLDGCVQPALAPSINVATARVLDRLGISLQIAADAGCCGAACHHTSGVEEGLDQARRNIDAWWPLLENGCETIVMTASGCGVHVKQYGHLLRSDTRYADKARRVSMLTRDLGEVLAQEDLSPLRIEPGSAGKIAFQSPCTLQHGQQLHGVVEKLLQRLGFALVPVPESHLCCGSAGTYSILQPGLSQQLRRRKLAALEKAAPDRIVTANIGCLIQLKAGTDLPVSHWVELLEP